MKVQSITLYQTDEVLNPRIPGGPAALGEFAKRLEHRMIVEYQVSSPGETWRALIVVIGPQTAKFWLIGPDGPAPEQETLRAALREVPSLAVTGPVALAMLCDLGTEYPAEKGPPVPFEWVEAVRAAGRQLSVEEILDRVAG